MNKVLLLLSCSNGKQYEEFKRVYCSGKSTFKVFMISIWNKNVLCFLLQTGGYFRYNDGWQLNFVSWAEDEPNRDKPCVYMDMDGKWRTAFCNQTMNSVCLQTTGLLVTNPFCKSFFVPKSESESHYIVKKTCQLTCFTDIVGFLYVSWWLDCYSGYLCCFMLPRELICRVQRNSDFRFQL